MRKLLSVLFLLTSLTAVAQTNESFSRKGVLFWDVSTNDSIQNLYGWNLYTTTVLTNLPPKQTWDKYWTTNDYWTTTGAWKTNGWNFAGFIPINSTNLTVQTNKVTLERGVNLEILSRTNDVWQWPMVTTNRQEYMVLTATNIGGESFPSSVVFLPAKATPPNNVGIGDIIQIELPPAPPPLP